MKPCLLKGLQKCKERMLQSKVGNSILGIKIMTTPKWILIIKFTIIFLKHKFIIDTLNLIQLNIAHYSVHYDVAIGGPV